MMQSRRERLAAMRRELARQNEEWGRTKEALRKLGEATFAVPEDVLERIDACVPAPSSATPINAVRG
jgi:hypothetical protein